MNATVAEITMKIYKIWKKFLN